MEHTDGYAEDKFSFETADMIREMIGKPDAHVHFMVGGTPTNTVTIAAEMCIRDSPYLACEYFSLWSYTKFRKEPERLKTW